MPNRINFEFSRPPKVCDLQPGEIFRKAEEPESKIAYMMLSDRKSVCLIDGLIMNLKGSEEIIPIEEIKLTTVK